MSANWSLMVYRWSVAKCRGSWVVGRGRGSWVWVWVSVVGKQKVFQKKIILKNQKAKSYKIHETKISVYMPVLLSFPRSAKQVSKSFSTNRH